jgi:hypothetical protein
MVPRAASALSDPDSSDLLIAWLEALRLKSGNFKLGRDGIEQNADGSEGTYHLTGTIERICEASADYCRELEGKGLEAETRKEMEQIGSAATEQLRSKLEEKDLLACCMSGTPLNLSDVAQPPLFVPGAIPAFRLLEMFKKSRTHVVLVVDEYGDVEGLITINDFFEDLVGEVASADKPHERRAAQRPDGSWLIDGKMPGP